MYGRVALGYAVLLPILLAAQAAAVVTLANQREQTNGRERLERVQVAKHLATIASDRLQSNPQAPLTELVAGLQPSARLFLVMTSGDVLQSRGPDPDALRTFADGLGEIDRVEQFPHEWSNGNYGASPIVLNETVVGLVGVTPRSMFERYGGTIVALGTGLLFVGNLALALVVVKPIRQRLRNLYTAAARLRDGDLDARAQVTGSDELAEMARVFNEMATELVTRTSALEVSDRLRRQLLADVSHELMTPLTSVLARLETLAMEDLELSKPQRTDQVSAAMAEARRLERLIRELLEAARMESGSVPLAKETISVPELFDAIAGRHEPERARKAITLEIQVRAASLIADRFRLDQALDNLVANALRHTPYGGRVLLSAEDSSGAVRITVWDSGGSLEPEHLPHVFDRFYKVDSTNGIASPGSGLGLAIVKAIAQRHGGRVGVTSSADMGTTFTIDLPQTPSGSVHRSDSGSANL